MGRSGADHSVSPPRVDIPREYNAADDLIGRNLDAGRAAKLAYIDDAGSYSYGELAKRVNRFASALATLGLDMEQRVLLAMLDTIDWPTAFLGAIRAGVVPVAVNTLLTTKDYEFMLNDSRARVLFVSEALLPQFEPLIGLTEVASGILSTYLVPTGLNETGCAPPRVVSPTSTALSSCFML